MSYINPFHLLPPLKTLKGFEATARLLNVRKAADELNITHSAVSHQIHLLEEHLGIRLFHREARGVTLTHAGELFYPIVRQALTSILACAEAVRSSSQGTSLRLQTFVSVSIGWLTPIITQFNQNFPDIELQIKSCSPNEEFQETDADIGIIYRKTVPPPEFYWMKLFPGKLQLICSPALISDISDFKTANVLDYRLLTVYTANDQWTTWLEHFNLKKDLSSQSIFVDTYAIAIEMAKAGHGIALINGPFADQALAKGELVHPINDEILTGGEWGLICNQNRLRQHPVDIFVDWIQKHYIDNASVTTDSLLY